MGAGYGSAAKFTLKFRIDMERCQVMSHARIQSLPEKLADTLRDNLIAGDFTPGQKLSEQTLSDHLGVSRNTLREAFRLLTKEGLLQHEANRGVFVMTPSIASIVDIYRVRRVIECGALAMSYPKHPAVLQMQQSVDVGKSARDLKNWQQVGSANMKFHSAIVSLSDSNRLSACYAQTAAQLRLSFALLDNPEMLYAPYVDMNAEILEKLENAQTHQAASKLEAYLNLSERTVLAALTRATSEH